MPRGETGRLTAAGKRDRTATVRLTDAELERWHAARERTGRKELGAWIRSVVEEALTGNSRIPGDVARVPKINHEAYLELAAIGNNLNQLVRWSHLNEQLHPALEAAIEEVGNAALAVRGLRPVLPGEEDDDEDLAEADDVADRDA